MAKIEILAGWLEHLCLAAWQRSQNFKPPALSTLLLHVVVLELSLVSRQPNRCPWHCRFVLRAYWIAEQASASNRDPNHLLNEEISSSPWFAALRLVRERMGPLHQVCTSTSMHGGRASGSTGTVCVDLSVSCDDRANDGANKEQRVRKYKCVSTQALLPCMLCNALQPCAESGQASSELM